MSVYRILKNYIPSEIDFYDPEDFGVRIYGHTRMFFPPHILKDLYVQLNVGGGHFSQMVKYAREMEDIYDHETIYRRKEFAALGIMIEGGYQYSIGNIRFDAGIGLQYLPRMLPTSISHDGDNYKIYKADIKGFSDNHLWYRNGPGKLIEFSFGVNYIFNHE